MDSAQDPLAAISASAPFPTIPAAASPRPRGARTRRHAAPFRSDHPAAVAAASSRRLGCDVSHRPASFAFGQQEGSQSVVSWGVSGDANFVFGSGVVGASETTKSLSSGSGDASLSSLLSAVDKLALDGTGRQSDADTLGGDDSVPRMNAGDSLGTSGGNSSFHEGSCLNFHGDQTEQLHEESGCQSQTIRCETVESRPVASPAACSSPCIDENVSTEFAKSGDSLSVLNPVDEGNSPKDGSEISAHGGDNQQNFFVFGQHSGYQQFTANANQADVNKVDSDNKEGVTYRSEQPNASNAKDSMHTKFILQGAKHAFGSSHKDAPHWEPREISAAPKASDAVPSNLGYEDGSAKVSFNNSTLEATKNSHDGTEFMFSAKSEQSDQSGFTFSASTSDQSTSPSQKRQNKKKVGGMSNHANSIESRPTSTVGLAYSEVSASQRSIGSGAQWSEYREMEPKMVTFSRGVTCTETENFGYHGDCEVWRLRGNQAFAEGQLTKAEECYTHGIGSFAPTDASRKALMLCYSNRAAARMSLGKMRDALSDCREAIDIDSSFLKAQVRAANCLLALGDVEEAKKAFEMCLKSNSMSNLDHKIVEEASDGLQKVQKLSGFILQSKEYLITKEFGKISSALQMISDALSISIYSDNLMEMKAEALLLLRRYEEVIQFCQETLHLAERNSICFCPGEHSESNNLESCCSVKLWRYHLIAKSYFFLGKLEEAQQFLKKYEQTKVMECRCEKQSQQSISSFSMAISELLRLKAISRRSSLYELIRDYYQAANDLRRLISLLEKQLQENMSMPSEKTESICSNLNRANLRLASLEREARKGATLNMYLILGIEPSCSSVDIKKAYRKAALRHHPDKACKSLVRNKNMSDALWREVTTEIRRDADYLFKLIGKAYTMLSEPTMKSN
ncbi:hypothetical protein EJB05_32341, partial [Eragrostis curvula]